MTTPITPPTRRLTLAWATTLAVLCGVTWPLWSPLRALPRVSLIPAPEGVAVFLGFALLAPLVIQLVVAIMAPVSRWSVGAVAATLAGLMLLDQLRWQPWAYHALIVGATLATLDGRRAVICLRAVTLAVYGFSAISKIDAEFAATLGSQMTAVLGVPEAARGVVAYSLPLGELALTALLAASLWRPRLALPACAAAIMMHATTIGVLSPWGLGHSPSVLLWNAGFAWQTFILFAPATTLPSKETAPRWRPVGLAACGLAVLAPLGTPFGLWDNWPGWALYSPGGERATLFVEWSSAGRLPRSLRGHVDEQTSEIAGGWRRVRLSDWVLVETHSPIYPQNRVFCALVSGLLERGNLSGKLLVVTEGIANRFTRERPRSELVDPDEIAQASRLLGVTPRVAWPRD